MPSMKGQAWHSILPSGLWRKKVTRANPTGTESLGHRFHYEELEQRTCLSQENDGASTSWPLRTTYLFCCLSIRVRVALCVCLCNLIYINIIPSTQQPEKNLKDLRKALLSRTQNGLVPLESMLATCSEAQRPFSLEAGNIFPRNLLWSPQLPQAWMRYPWYHNFSDEGLERWLNVWELMGFLQRTCICFPAPMSGTYNWLEGKLQGLWCPLLASEAPASVD